MFAVTAPVDTVLGRRQLYMLPTRHGLQFALVLAVLLLAAINYGNGLAYALTFLLASVAVVSMLHTHRNLHRLRISAGACAPVFAGQSAQFEIVLTNDASTPRFGILLSQDNEERGRADVPARGSVSVALGVTARRRGRLPLPPFKLATRFPLGLLYSWSRPIHLQQLCLVYPAPSTPMPFRASPAETLRPEQGLRPGGDDFIGVREFLPGDSSRHVDWKAFARTGMLAIKQFGGGYQTLVWLDWDALEGLDTEARLSVLCRWVLDAAAAGMHYGLRLPDTTITPDHGETHQHRCLKALALFQV
ncbi:MAG: DUF58 domain-containing protein [Gammaproteobacteria bacterium]|nr:DUF58 domain-containing protein [Gammaproteobacteria bacterium]